MAVGGGRGVLLMEGPEAAGNARWPIWHELGRRLIGWQVRMMSEACRLPTTPSGREWQGAQPGEGASGRLTPGPTAGEMQGESARRAGKPSGHREEASSEGLGGHQSLAQTDARCPAGQVMGHHLARSQAALAAKRPEGRWLSPTPYLRSRMAFSTSAWRRWPASSSRVSPSRPVMKP